MANNIKVNKDSFFSPQAIFIYYMLLSALGIMAFRFIFQGEDPPIPYFSRNWRLIQGVLEILNLFPTLAITALVIPFGLKVEQGEDTRFSLAFLKRITGNIITAISAAVIYGLLFFLVLPQVQDFRTNMRFQGQIYRLAKERAEGHAALGEWPQVYQFVAICEGIWPDSPELASLKGETDINIEEFRVRRDDEELAASAADPDYWDTAFTGQPGQRRPVSLTEALSMAKTAQQEERYYDAHWLATLAGRQARPGSPEQADAVRAASLAWNSLNSLSPNVRERKLYDLYHLKQSGYEAMVAGDWIQAYYIFLDLSEKTPDDPDVANFLVRSENGIRETAFFTDEMDMAVGEVLASAVYSIPVRPQSGPGSGDAYGRAVLRFSSISYLSDASYGFGLEFISFDENARLETRFEAPYAKIIPKVLDGQQRIVVMMRALDRYDKNKRWEPTWSAPATARSPIGDAQIVLDMSYENFLLLSRARRGIDSLNIAELFTAVKALGSYGYIPQVIEAEAIYRLCEPLIFLPMAIFAIVIGWRYRARKRPRYIAVPMLFVLPLIFNGGVHFYRHILNTLGIWTILNLGFSSAMAIFTVGIGVLFVLSLIILASQRD